MKFLRPLSHFLLCKYKMGKSKNMFIWNIFQVLLKYRYSTFCCNFIRIIQQEQLFCVETAFISYFESKHFRGIYFCIFVLKIFCFYNFTII